MDLKSILDSTIENAFYENMMQSYYENRILFINQEIDECIIEDCIAYILKWNQEDKGLQPQDRKTIKIYLNSNGGDSIVAMQLVDVIKMSITPIMIVGMSLVASAAFHIFIAGHERVCFENSIFLMHDGTISISNNTSKAKDTMKFIDELESRAKKHILDKTTMDEKFYDDHYDVELYMYADKAKEFGIVNKIIGIDCTLDCIL